MLSSTTMMYPDAMDLGFGCPMAQLKGQNSFEDEVEDLYFSCANEQPATLSAQQVADDSGMMDLDDLLVFANPEEVTGQTLVKKELETVDANIDLDTDDVIQDMATFLSKYESSDEPMENSVVEDVVDSVVENLAAELLTMEQQQVLKTLDTECPFEKEVPNAIALTEEELEQAENLLDDLLGLEEPKEDVVEQPKDILEAAVTSENLQDSGFFDDDTSFSIAGVSEIQTENGNVIIVVQSEDAAATATQEPQDDDDDSDWSPEQPVKRKPGRKPAVRQSLTDKVSKRTYKTVNDRKQRKKLQNVEAARRYRDKKKNEQQLLEEEEQEMAVKNKALKAKHVDLKNEMKTLKKLMVELGLLRVVKK